MIAGRPDMLWSLAPFLVLVFAAASTGALFRPGEWYARLDKPNWTPPGWLFGPVWLVLYVAMAVAAWRIVSIAGWTSAAGPLALWLAQLVLNAAWSWIFFGLRRPRLALIEMAALFVAIAATVVAFASVDALAAWLLAPYLAWVAFAFALNAAIAMRNPARPA